MVPLPRRVLLASLPVLVSSCTLVGYPAGSVPAPPSALGETARVGPAGSNPANRAGDAGRTYQVFGVTYQVLETPEGYDEEGMASWYGQDFHGRPTASGETYDMNRPSAAHRTLPLHTWVEVTNLDNGRRMVLRINDRGPFARTESRIVDLSYAAAAELGVLGPGTARVRVRALTPQEVPR